LNRLFGLAILAAAFCAASPALAQDEYVLDSHKDRIAPITIAPKLGYVFNQYAGLINYDYDNNNLKLGGTANGLNLQFDVDFTGPAGSFELAPYYTYRVTNLNEMQNWLGLYLGYAYRWRTLHGKLYPSLGVGMRLGILLNTSSFAMVHEYTLRIPVGINYYLTKELAILAELGVGYATLSFWNDNFVDYFMIGGFQLDVSLGVRWP